MSTIAQMKALARPLLELHPELFMLRREIFLRPVNHVLRFVLLENTSGRYHFRPYWAAMLLCEIMDVCHFTWSMPMYFPVKDKHWDVRQSDIEQHLVDKVESEALPSLHVINTVADFAEFASDNTFPRVDIKFFPISQITLNIALGQMDAARANHKVLLDRRRPNLNPGGRLNRILDELGPPLDRDDRAALAAVLHRWEAETVKNLKLEKHWEPTPFPIEQM